MDQTSLMNKYAIKTREPIYPIEWHYLNGEKIVTVWGSAYDEIEAETRGKARKMFTNIYCEGEFATPLEIHKMWLDHCSHCKADMWIHNDFSDWIIDDDYNNAPLWCGDCKHPFYEDEY
jgi:hypothetical protein